MQALSITRGTVPVLNPSVRVAGSRPVVLVVSSDRSVREGAAEMLERDGYAVLTAAHSGHAVLACINAGRVDVLATELSMVDTSGPALAARLRRMCPGLATVYFANAGTAECPGVVVRPFTRDDLRAAVARASGASVSAS